MLGGVLIAIVVILVIPLGFLMFAGVLTAIFSAILQRHGEAANEGSEYIDLNT